MFPPWEKGKVNEEGEKGKERMREKWEADRRKMRVDTWIPL